MTPVEVLLFHAITVPIGTSLWVSEKVDEIREAGAWTSGLGIDPARLVRRREELAEA